VARWKVLVTGGAGFIGSSFIRYVLREHPDWIIINLDKLTYAGNLANLSDIEATYGISSLTRNPESLIPRYFFVKGDICDRDLVDSLFSGAYFTHHSSLVTGLSPNPESLIPNVVINFAAESHVDRSILDASPFIETNIKGTQVLLDVARSYWLADSHKPSTAHHPPVFVQISTDEVYGTLSNTSEFTEESCLRPSNPYAASKAAAELLCHAYHKTYNLPIIITRSSNNYGPYQFPEKLIPLMIRNALVGKRLPVYGEGKEVRHWLYVEDNCRAIDLVLRNGRPGEAYNIGGSCEKENIDVVNLICNILEEKLRSSPLILNPESFNPRIQFIADPRGAAHDFRYALDCSKIRGELGWEPTHDFTKGLEQVVEWYVENQDWVEKVITGEYRDYYEKIYGSRG